VKIELTREVAAPIDEVWQFFNDIPRVVTCMPGASLTNVIDDETFEGTLGVKIGPIAANYQGTMHLDEVNQENHTVHMTGSGKDKKGAGSAQAKITATLAASSPATTSMSVNSDVRLTGRVASLGRGIQDVAGKLFEDFARRADEELAAQQATPEEADRRDTRPPPDSAETVSAGGDPAAEPATRRGPAEGQNDIKVLPLIRSVLKDKILELVGRLRSKLAARAQRGSRR
jgi:carbon monoxide dehydrogenase subunit G